MKTITNNNFTQVAQGNGNSLLGGINNQNNLSNDNVKNKNIPKLLLLLIFIGTMALVYYFNPKLFEPTSQLYPILQAVKFLIGLL